MGLMSSGLKLKSAEFTSWSVEPVFRLVEAGMFQILEPTALFFLYSDLKHLKYCLINPVNSKIYT